VEVKINPNWPQKNQPKSLSQKEKKNPLNNSESRLIAQASTTHDHVPHARA